MTEMKLTVFQEMAHIMFHNEGEVMFGDVAANVYATQFEYQQQQLQFIDKMWKQLWEEQKQGVDVCPTRTTLLELGQQCYARYLAASTEGAVSTRMEADMTKSLAHAQTQLIDTLSEIAVTQKWTTEDELDPKELVQSQVTMLKSMITGLEELREENTREQSAAEKLLRQFEDVFGDTEEPEAKSMETAETSTIEMLKIARSKGYLHCVLPTKDVLEDRKRFGKQIGELLDAIKPDIEQLRKDGSMTERVEYCLEEGVGSTLQCPTLKVYPEDTFRFLQNTFGLQPNSKLFDTWFHLFIEALKDFLISGNRWTDSNWTMTTLPDSVDRSTASFVANKELDGQLLPTLSVDYWTRRIADEVEAPTEAAPEETKKSREEPEETKKSREEPKQTSEKPKQPIWKPQPMSNTKLILCSTFTIAGCVVWLVYAYVVVALRLFHYVS
eukprot:GHVS01001254.1.p1 GENE.GHVS01001254.1~~GHVS01001254.1.p1  ORF type:complete len:441 (+),score=67.55 GHVS01001254.1:1439-2761(+)